MTLAGEALQKELEGDDESGDPRKLKKKKKKNKSSSQGGSPALLRAASDPAPMIEPRASSLPATPEKAPQAEGGSEEENSVSPRQRPTTVNFEAFRGKPLPPPPGGGTPGSTLGTSHVNRPQKPAPPLSSQSMIYSKTSHFQTVSSWLFVFCFFTIPLLASLSSFLLSLLKNDTKILILRIRKRNLQPHPIIRSRVVQRHLLRTRRRRECLYLHANLPLAQLRSLCTRAHHSQPESPYHIPTTLPVPHPLLPTFELAVYLPYQRSHYPCCRPQDQVAQHSHHRNTNHNPHPNRIGHPRLPRLSQTHKCCMCKTCVCPQSQSKKGIIFLFCRCEAQLFRLQHAGGASKLPF